MHIVLVSTSYPDAGSGSEAAGGFVADFAHELAKHARVTVVAATGGESSIRTEGQLEIHRFAVRRWPLSLLKPYRPADWLPIMATLRDGRRTLDHVVREARPDYIFGLWALPSGHWARVAGRKYDIPYGLWALGSDIWDLGRVPVLRSYLRSVLVGAQDRFADGIRLAEEVQQICSMECDFLPSARMLPARELSNPAAAPPYKLAFLGRWHRNKGVDIFLEALLQLQSDDWSRIAEVRIHGGGPLEEDVHRLSGELQSQGRPVSVGGYLNTDEATEFIAWTDYLVLPSRIESIPVIFSDAAQLRRPLVATPVGDLPDLHSRYEYGVLADSPTASALADALREALAQPADRFRPELDAIAAQFELGAVAERFVRHVGEHAT